MGFHKGKDVIKVVFFFFFSLCWANGKTLFIKLQQEILGLNLKHRFDVSGKVSQSCNLVTISSVVPMTMACVRAVGKSEGESVGLHIHEISFLRTVKEQKCTWFHILGPVFLRILCHWEDLTHNKKFTEKWRELLFSLNKIRKC